MTKHFSASTLRNTEDADKTTSKSNKILVDSNVILDIFTDSIWFEWSSTALRKWGEEKQLCINPIIYAEVSISFSKIEEVELALPDVYFERLNLPLETAFLAGKIFLDYRKNGGNKSSPLPDFFIGAHATVLQMPLLTRDKKRYKTYFPKLQLISPDN